MIRLGTSKRRIFDSVFVFFLRVIIHRLPSKNVCRRSAVRSFTSEYAKPVNTEKTNKSRTSSWEIGRASCRDSVLSAVVAVTLAREQSKQDGVQENRGREQRTAA